MRLTAILYNVMFNINPNKRFVRSRSARTHLFLSTDGSCAECGCELEVSWHTDHVMPWSRGGKTVRANLRPTCPKCNLRKGNQMTITPAMHDYENMNHFKDDFPNSSNMRTCQVGAYNTIVQKLVYEKAPSCSVFLPTGTGKSDVVRSIAIGLQKRGFCAGTWAFSPNKDLRKQLQIDDVSGPDGFFSRIGESYHTVPFIEVDSLDTKRFRNSEVMESFTVQFLVTNSNVDDFIEHAELIRRKTNKPLVAIFDESHLYSTENQWGDAAKKMSDAGILIVLITGTPYRTDKIKIPGFRLEKLDTSTRKFVKTTKSDDPLVIKVVRGTKEVTKYRLHADYEYSYSRAWEDDVILKPDPQWVDATYNVYQQILSEMSKSQSDRLLRSFLLDERTICSSVKTCIENIHKRKVADDTCAAIVTTLSDLDENLSDLDDEDDVIADMHASKIEREFAKQAPHLKILVVTSNRNADGGLLRFKKNTDYDVLIVKAMGTIGFNCKRIKVVLNLSNFRTLTAFIQLINRGCRHFGGVKNFDVILPKDRGMRVLWQQFQDNTQLEVEDSKIIDSETEEKTAQESDEVKEKGEFDDHNVSFDANVCRNKKDEIIEMYDRKKPHLANVLSNQQKLDEYIQNASILGDNWLERLTDYDYSSITNTENLLIDPNEEEYRLRGEAKEIVHEITLELISLSGQSYNNKLYGKHVSHVWTCVKRCCGFAPRQSIDNLSGIENFKRITKSCVNLRNEMRRISPSSDFDFKHYLYNFCR